MVKMDRIKIFQNKLLVLSLIVIFIMIMIAIFAPILAPHDPNLIDLSNKLKEPSLTFPLGTDHLGRCVLSRIIYGTQVSIGAAFLVMGISIFIGIIIGTFAGYKGGWIDQVFMRLCDVLLSFPSLVLSLALIGILGPTFKNLIIALVIVQWVPYARMIRGLMLVMKEQHFIMAAKIAGTTDTIIIIRHMLPHILPQVLVFAFLDIGTVILHISGLSFLGLGIQPPTAEWGMMINDSKQFLRNYPSLMLYPGMMIMLVVMSFNLLGDSLRDLLDPTHK
ncbi:nickel ABC transporter permease subunit NikC [Domibacillus aminovorans]|uniref:Nickel ABC transporter permease subunit NikC n=1 Tax=Domibacillus aminovorans TaxID=29332 RepID=A0A177KX58_9BACI|nr:nickel ABC transporter permease subunit NikC [Domibacillus aminovorans]OAH57959.1 nickel ABC transporter permease subunit NikC [Domibacillus aminovorans]